MYIHVLIVALLVPAGFLVGTGFIPCDKGYLGIVFLTVAVGFTGLVSSGYGSNFQDIAARYISMLFEKIYLTIVALCFTVYLRYESYLIPL